MLEDEDLVAGGTPLPPPGTGGNDPDQGDDEDPGSKRTKERKKKRETKKASGKNAPSAQAHPTQPRRVTEHDRGLLQPRPAVHGRDGRKASHPTSTSLGQKGHPSPTRFHNRDGRRSTLRGTSPPQRAHRISAAQTGALTRAVDRMLKHHDARQVVEEIRRWHPKWSKARVANLVVGQALPRWAVGKGAGQGKTPYQSAPYYRGQRPMEVVGGRPVYKNPQRVPSLNEIAMAGYTKKDLAWFAQSRQRNAPKVAADARWIARHPALSAAILASIPEGGAEIAAIADAPTLYSAGRNAAHHHYTAAALDLATVRLGGIGKEEATLARSEAAAAQRANRTIYATKRAIVAAPGRSTPPALQARLDDAIHALRVARAEGAEARQVSVIARREARIAAYLSAAAEHRDDQKEPEGR